MTRLARLIAAFLLAAFSLASASSSSTFPTPADDAFVEWFADSGGVFSGNGVYSVIEDDAASSSSSSSSSSSRARGMFAKADVADGDELLTLPLDAALVVPSPFAGEIIRRVLSHTGLHATASAW